MKKSGKERGPASVEDTMQTHSSVPGRPGLGPGGVGVGDADDRAQEEMRTDRGGHTVMVASPARRRGGLLKLYPRSCFSDFQRTRKRPCRKCI